DVTAAPAFRHAGRTTVNGDRSASRARVPVLQAFLDILDPSADTHSIAGAESANDACLSRATGHGRPQDDRRTGRMRRTTRCAVTIIHTTSSYMKVTPTTFCIARMSPFSSLVMR